MSSKYLEDAASNKWNTVQLDPVLGATLVTANMAPKSGLALILKVELYSVCKMWQNFVKKKFSVNFYLLLHLHLEFDQV